MVEPSEFQRGEKDMLRKIIMISNRYTNIKRLIIILEAMLKQHDEIFKEEYL